MAEAVQAYQTLVENITNANVLNAHNSQFMALNPIQIFNLLIQRSQSWDLLESHRLQYITELRFPLVNGHSVSINRLRFMSMPKEAREQIFESTKQLVHQIIIMQMTMVDQIDPTTHEKMMYIFERLMASMQGSQGGEENPLASMIPSELVDNLMGILTQEENEIIQAQLNELTAAYGQLSIPAVMMIANDGKDPRFQRLKDTFEKIFESKTEEETAKVTSMFGNGDVMKKLGAMSSNVLGGRQGQDMSSMMSSMMTRGLDTMTRPDINDEDPMNLSEKDFNELQKEVLGSRHMQQ